MARSALAVQEARRANVKDLPWISRIGRLLVCSVLILSGFAEGCAPGVARGRTHVARVERLRTAVVEYDRFFAVVYAMQLAINESEREKIDLVARLGHALGLAEGADLPRCAAVVRTFSSELAARRLQLGIELDPGRLVAALNDAPVIETAVPVSIPGVSASSAPPELPTDFPEAQAAAERAVSVDVTVAGGALPAEYEARVTAVRAAIRTAMGLKRRMDSIATVAPQVRAIARLLAGTTRQRAAAQASMFDEEFRDAISFLEGAPGRAQAQGQSALQMAVRLRASANSPGAQ